MNREIKFRGTPVNGKHFVYGSLVKNGSGFIIIEHRQQPEIHLTDSLWRIDSPAFQVIPESVGQYTGLKDKNGKEIYEGDLMSCDGKIKVVVYNQKQCCFELKFQTGGGFKDYIEYFTDRGGVVIGNIHEHKNLLK